MSDTTTVARARLERLGGIAALLAAGVLAAGIVGLTVGAVALRPWLAVLFGIDVGTGGVSMGSLHAIAPVDVVLLVLTGVAFAGFWPGPGKPHKAWMTFAVLLPFAGIAVLVATGLAGRSGLMGGLLVLSIFMLTDRSHRSLGYVGLAASLLLLIGDFATTGPASSVVAGIVGGGYMLLTAWFLLAAARLLGWRRSQGVGAIAAGREGPDSGRTEPGRRAQIEGEIMIDRPVGEVFDFVADERNEPRYNPQMTSVEKMSEGEIGPGARFKAEVLSGGRPVSVVIEFTTFERPLRLASRSTMPGMLILGALTFEAVGDATRMRWAWDLEPSGAMRLLTPLMVFTGRRQEREIWTSLKRCLEGLGPDREGERSGRLVTEG